MAMAVQAERLADNWYVTAGDVASLTEVAFLGPSSLYLQEAADVIFLTLSALP